MAADTPARMFSPSGLPRTTPRPKVMAMSPMATTSRILTSRSSSSPERGASAFIALEALGDDPDLAGCPGGYDDAFSPAGDDAGSRIGHRMALVEGRIRAVRRDRAGLGQRLAGRAGSMSRPSAFAIRTSAGTTSPPRSSTISPGTSAIAGRSSTASRGPGSSGHWLPQRLEGTLARTRSRRRRRRWAAAREDQQSVATLTHDDGQGTGDRQQHHEGLRRRLQEHVGDRLMARRLELVGPTMPAGSRPPRRSGPGRGRRPAPGRPRRRAGHGHRPAPCGHPDRVSRRTSPGQPWLLPAALPHPAWCWASRPHSRRSPGRWHGPYRPPIADGRQVNVPSAAVAPHAGSDRSSNHRSCRTESDR